MNPLVSIIIPVFNRAEYILETINSVIEQEYKNWECIIVDDGSTDGTITTVENCIKKSAKLFLYHRPRNTIKGASSCRNYGLSKAEGDLVQFLDSDDLLDKNKLSEQVKYFKPSTLEIITCKWGGFREEIDSKKYFKHRYNSYKNFQRGFQLLKSFGNHNEFFPLHVYLTPFQLIKKVGPWNENLTNNDDAEFFTRVLLSASAVKFVPNTNVYYRYNSKDKLSALDTKEKILSSIESWKLIESHIKRRNLYSTLRYVDNAKDELIKQIKEQDSVILEENKKFLKRETCYPWTKKILIILGKMLK